MVRAVCRRRPLLGTGGVRPEGPASGELARLRGQVPAEAAHRAVEESPRLLAATAESLPAFASEPRGRKSERVENQNQLHLYGNPRRRVATLCGDGLALACFPERQLENKAQARGHPELRRDAAVDPTFPVKEAK